MDGKQRARRESKFVHEAVLAALHGLSEQFTLSVQLDSALPRALQASLPIALVEAEI